MGDITIEALLGKLGELRELDPHHQLFGAQTHGYALGPPLSELELARFEAAEALRLPDEFRRFLAAAGNGGAGPVYGLKPLAAFRPEPLEDDSVLERPADGSSPFDGCIELAEIGCGYYYFLATRGAAAGQVWADYSAGSGKVRTTGDSFLGWYDRWLEDSLAERAAAWLEQAVKTGKRHALLEAQLPRLVAQAAAYPDWATAQLRLAAVLTYRGEWEAAEAALARTAALEPRLAEEVELARVVILWRQDRLADVAARVTALFAERNFFLPVGKQLQEVRLIALKILGRTEEALQAAAERAAFDASNLVAWLELAELQAVAGDRAAAEATVRRAAADNANGSDAAVMAAEGLQVLSQRLAAVGRPDDAAHFAARAAPAI